MALTTSSGESPLACSSAVLRADVDLALLAAIGRRHLCAGDGNQIGTDEVGVVIVQLRFGDGLAREGELQDGDVRRVIGENERRRECPAASARLDFAKWR